MEPHKLDSLRARKILNGFKKKNKHTNNLKKTKTGNQGNLLGGNKDVNMRVQSLDSKTIRIVYINASIT